MKFSHSRRALAQPRFLLAMTAMASALGGVSYLASAQSGLPPVKMTSSSGVKKSKATNLMDLPALVKAAGAAGRLGFAGGSTGASSRGAAGGRTAQAVVTRDADGVIINASGFNLTEVDLTPNTPSDEREPIFSPSGDLIAFRSNGADSNGDGAIDAVNANGRFHIWVMNSDGSDQRQVTGLAGNADAGRNQFRPSWSPGGNQLVYVDGDGTAAQLFVVSPLAGSTPVPEQRTFFAGEKRAPAWAPNGLTISFATRVDPSTGATLNSFDLYSIDPGGDAGTALRITGGAADPVGDTVDDLNPAYSITDGGSLYFSSNRDINANGEQVRIPGRRILRLRNNALEVVTNPAGRRGFRDSDVINDDFPTLSLTGVFPTRNNTGNNVSNRNVTEQLGFQTNSRLNDSDTNLDLNIWNLPVAATLAGAASVPEPADAAFILTNSLSSSSTAQPGVVNGAGQFVGAEDFAPDQEPSFNRSIVSPQSIGTLAFASSRFVNPNPAAVRTNPTGGNGVASTNDIFTTGTIDTTPPILVPQTIGNQEFPVVSPTATLAGQGQGNPRTAEAGLVPGAEPGTPGSLKIAVVINEQESGLDTDSIVAVIRDANQLITTRRPSPVNESVIVDTQVETGYAQIETSAVLTAVDDGVNERQAGAVAGDGIFYCSADVKTPVSGEYYIDIVATDQRLNKFTYDNIWGFATSRFDGRGQDLLVSDYTVGQLFPNILSGNTLSTPDGNGGDDGRFARMVPIESYLIKANGPTGTDGGGVPDPMTGATFPATGNAFPNAAIYRILCRGPVTAALLNTYVPGIVTQIDPNETSFRDGKFLSAKTRRVSVARALVTWASPYTGTVFGSVGTLRDAATQTLLTDFSNAGGRLFVMGRDIGFGLTSGGSVSSDFLSNTLGATYGGDVPTGNGNGLDPGVVIVSEAGGFIRPNLSYGNQTTQERRNLQIPFHFENKNPLTDNWDDAALNLNPNTSAGVRSNGGVGFADQAVGVQPDELLPSGAGGGTVTPSYTIDGRVVGHRVVRPIATGESRAVVFGFGLESVNRRWRKPTNDFGIVALDARAVIMRGISSFMKTGSISGRVANASTNQPIPNFLVRATLQNNAAVTFLARTDTNGNYSILGLPEAFENGLFRVDPAAVDAAGKLLPLTARIGVNGAQSSPPGFFSGTTRNNVAVVGGANTGSVNLSPIPIRPGSLRGRVVTTDPADATKQIPANGLFVLVRSVAESSIFPGGGQYAAVVRTDATGNFSIPGVPALIDLQVFLNPSLNDIPAKSGLRANFTAPTFTGQFQNPNLGTRLITGLNRPNGSTNPALQVPSNGTFTLNDSSPDQAADSGTPLLLGRFLATLTGPVTVNSKPFPNINVRLFTSGGAAVTPAITAVTDTAGIYSLTNVPAGSYIVRATTRLGATATSATLTIANTAGGGTNPTITVPRINITAPTLSGKVNLRIIGPTTRNSALPGATVELLGGTGRSFTPTITVTADSMGKYVFNVAPNGSYQLRATADIDGSTSASAVSSTITVGQSGNSPVPDLAIIRFLVTGRVTTSAGAGASGAIVELTVGDNTLRSTTANGSGTYSFTNVLPGTYVVRAFASAQAGAASGSAPVRGVAGATTSSTITLATTSVPAVDVKLTGTNPTPLPTPTPTPGNGNGTDGSPGGSVGQSFAANGTYTMSFPYAVENVLGTLTVDQAFSTSLASGGYRLFFFDAARQKNRPVIGQDLVEITNGSFKLTRGQGYVLITGANAVALQTPATNSLLKSFAGTSFSIPLTWNTTFLSDTSEPNNRNNGYNLIGFPFDPNKYSTVSFAGAQVKYGTTTYESIDAAAAAGIIDRQLYTISASGVRTPVAFDARNIRSFQGLFVHILRKDQNVTLVLRNPT